MSNNGEDWGQDNDCEVFFFLSFFLKIVKKIYASTSPDVINLKRKSICTKITEVNVSVFVHRRFHENFSPIIGTKLLFMKNYCKTTQLIFIFVWCFTHLT